MASAGDRPKPSEVIRVRGGNVLNYVLDANYLFGIFEEPEQGGLLCA